MDQSDKVVDLEVLVATRKSEMEIGRPSRDVGVNAENAAFPIGPTGERLQMNLERGRLSCKEQESAQL